MTRYPKSGRGRKWTVAEPEAVGALWRGDSLADGDGLSGTVRVSDAGTVTLHWRYAFKRAGRVAWHYCGTWPLVSLETIRAARDAARDALKRSADPNEKRQADRLDERERVGEVKEIAPGRYGFKAVLKHVPDRAFAMDEQLYRRLGRRFHRELALWGAADDIHMVMIATFSIAPSGIPTIAELSLMPVTRQWLSAPAPDFRAMVAQLRQRLAPLRP